MYATRTFLLALAAALALSFTAQPAEATVARYLTLDEHLELSPLVVRVRVERDQRSFVGEDGLPRKETKLTVLETFKGDRGPGAKLWLRQIGTVDSEEQLIIDGDASFVEGEEAVLFLNPGDGQTVFLTALGQSKFRVDRGGGGPILVRDISGLAFFNPSAGSRGLHSVGDAPVSLEIFSQTIRDLRTQAPR